MKIGIVGGTGDFGARLATRFVHAGHQVVIGSRKAEKAVEVVANIKANSHTYIELYAGTNADAAAFSDVVFLSIPFEHAASTINDISDVLHDKIIVSNIVPVGKLKSGFFRKAIHDSVGDLIAYMVPADNTVVAALHTIPAHQLTEGNLETFVFMDNFSVFDDIVRMFDSINIKAYDGGNLEDSIIAEDMTVFLLNLNKWNKTGAKSLKLV